MKTIQITNGSYNGREINGTFEIVNDFRSYSPSEIKSNYAKEGFAGYVRVMMEGKARYVHVRESVPYAVMMLTDSSVPEVSEADIEGLDLKIRRRFQVMDIMCAGVISDNMKSLIISGAPGVGKTFTFEKELRAAEEIGEIQQFTHIKGKMTPLFLFKTLYENSERGCVTLIDDCDSVFEDETAINILKAALDTGDERVITYGSSARWLEDNGIPNHFTFEGSVVFITNYDFDTMINSGSKMAPHLSALISRCSYLDLAIHSKLEVMVRIQQVVNESPLMERAGVDKATAGEMVTWLWDNYPRARELSIRTVLKMGEYHKLGDWKLLSEEMLLV